MIDGSDRSRLEEAKKVFEELVQEKSVETLPMIVLVNKHDQENCVSLGFITEYFEIEGRGSRNIKILHVSALTQ